MAPEHDSKGMLQQLQRRLAALGREAAFAFGEAAHLLGRAVLFLWDLVRPVVVLTLNVLAALILLFEEWGWEPLSNLLARLARFPLWAKLELFIAGLPPYAALLALAIPSTVLIPAKLLGVYFLTTGHLISAGVVIVLAKILSTALIARIFLLTKPALMQIGWFARAYEIFVPWQEALFTRIRASWVWRYGRVVKWRAHRFIHAAWSRVRPIVEESWNSLKPQFARVRLRLRSAWHSVVARVVSDRQVPPPRLPPPDRN